MLAEANTGAIRTGDGKETTECTQKWLKVELFEKLLRKTIGCYKQIKGFKAMPGTTAGENYATVLLRLEFDIELKDGKSISHSFMLKVGHDTAVFQEMMKQNNIFVGESEMYMHIVPELEQLYRDVGVEVKFGANCYEIEAPVDYVLMENLATKGFRIKNRLEGLDVAHTQSVLRKIAQWHAASAVRVAKKGPYVTIPQGLIAREQAKMFEDFVYSSSNTFLECVATYKGNESYLEQIKELQSKILNASLKLHKINPYEFNALNHGDLWSNNIMFQYDAEGKIHETYLIDYQGSKYGSVALDLYYFLLSSTQLECKISKFDRYIKYYHDNLTEHLKLLKYNQPLPSLRDIHASLYRYDVWGYITVISIMAAVLLDPTEAAKLENFFSASAEGVDFKKLMYSNARYRKHIEVVLPWLHNRGAFET